MNLFAFNLPLIALIPFLGAPLAAYAAKFSRQASAWVAALVTLLSLALLGPIIHLPFDNQTLIQSWSWLPSLGLDFAFRLDGLALLFTLLILLIGLLAVSYTHLTLPTNREV